MKRYIYFYVLLIAALLMSASSFAEDGNQWPKKIERSGTTVVIYQPQVESLSAIDMGARAAVSVTNQEFESPVFGAMWFDCEISTDRDDRTVRLLEMEVTAAKFPDVEEEKIEKLSAFLESEIPAWDLVLSLDQLLADLDMNESNLELSSGLNNTPPEIIFSTTPAILILVDGEPIFQEIGRSQYERVVNTPFFIVKDTKTDMYYINGGEHWYQSGNAADWEYVVKVPGKLEKIAGEAMGEAGEVADNEVEEEVIPAIILRTAPAELLQSDGEPDFAPIEGTSILYMTNTADDILMNIETQEYYVLVSGRWYRSASLENGSWTFVEPDQVPEVFASIPEESDMATVRSSVAGTREAKEAILENQIPQTAEVDRREARLEVDYDGKPKFEAVGETGMLYAVNTDKSVLQIEGRYYCCEDAIWFESSSATGPWVVSTEVPDQVQEIPPESPVYNVKYVYIYDYSPEVVYVGYTPGYVHSYVYRGCVYYGTGYHYRPWYGVRYYPRPVTYGFNVHWNPYTGWGFSYGVSVGWMTIGWGTPRYGWWGPAGYRHGYHYGYHHGYSRGYRAGYRAGMHASRPRPTPYGGAVASNNIYRNRAQGVTRTGNTRYDPRTGQVTRSASQTRQTPQAANRDNNVYADRNGNVYRREGNDWKRVDNSASRPSTRDNQPSQARPVARPEQPSQARPVARPEQPSQVRPVARPEQPSQARPATRDTRPSSPPGQSLNREYNSRNRGAQRTQQYNSNRNSYQYSRPSSSGSGNRSSGAVRSSDSRRSSGTRRR